MDDFDLIHKQNELYGELAQTLLSNEERIKHQQRNYFQTGARSIEAQKIEITFSDIQLHKAVCKELHLMALKALELKKTSEEHLLVKEQAQAARVLERFYDANFVPDGSHKAELVEAMTKLIAQLKELLTKWEHFLKEMAAKLAVLEALYKAILIGSIFPVLDEIRQELIYHYQIHPPHINNKTVDYAQLFHILMTNVGKKLQKHVIASQFEEQLSGGPYIVGEIGSVMEDKRISRDPLDEDDKQILREDIWQTMQGKASYLTLHHYLKQLDGIQKTIDYTKSISQTATKKIELLKNEITILTSDIAQVKKTENHTENTLQSYQNTKDTIDHMAKQDDKFITAATVSIATIINDCSQQPSFEKAKNEASVLSRPKRSSGPFSK